MKIDKEKFLFIYEQAEFKTLSESQQKGLIDLLSFVEEDSKITDARWVAYMLATTFHETAGTYLPIAEYGKGKGKKYGEPDVSGRIFFGRGFVQLTWADNYKTLGKALGVELYTHPELAMNADIAYKIMSYGMRTGMFTGVGLKKYINAEKCDYVNARRIINGTDCAEKIAAYAVKFDKILKEVTV